MSFVSQMAVRRLPRPGEQRRDTICIGDNSPISMATNLGAISLATFFWASKESSWRRASGVVQRATFGDSHPKEKALRLRRLKIPPV